MIDSGDSAMTLWALLLAVAGVVLSVSLGRLIDAPGAALGPLAGLLP